MTGRLAILFILAVALIGGGVMYYLQVYAYYDRLPPMHSIAVTVEDGSQASLPLRETDAIDATSSPLRFRLCAQAAGELPQSAVAATRPEPLTAPDWFECYDARTIDTALRTGAARAFLSQHEIARGVDRMIAIFEDGRVFAWHQLNGTLDN